MHPWRNWIAHQIPILTVGGSNPFGCTRMNPVEPERFDWVFLFLIFVILDIHFKSNGFLFKRKI